MSGRWKYTSPSKLSPPLILNNYLSLILFLSGYTVLQVWHQKRQPILSPWNLLLCLLVDEYYNTQELHVYCIKIDAHFLKWEQYKRNKDDQYNYVHTLSEEQLWYTIVILGAWCLELNCMHAALHHCSAEPNNTINHQHTGGLLTLLLVHTKHCLTRTNTARLQQTVYRGMSTTCIV